MSSCISRTAPQATRSTSPNWWSALARSSGLTVSDAGTAELTSEHAPGSLSAAIADRLGLRPAPGSGRSCVPRRCSAWTLPSPDLATVLGRGIVGPAPGRGRGPRGRRSGRVSAHGLGFRHPMIRAALYDEIPAPVRAAWHREAGRALAEAGAPADRVARQLLQAVRGPADTAEPMDEWILRWLDRDGAAAGRPGPPGRRGAPRLAPWRDHRPTRHSMTACSCRLAEALYRVGDAAEAERVAQRGLAGHRRSRSPRGPALDAGPVPDTWPAGSRNPSPR